MAVTPDEYELPVAVADTCAELSKMINVDKMTIYKQLNRSDKKVLRRNKTSSYRYYTVNI